VPSMSCSGSVDCRGSRIGRRIDDVRRYSSPLAQEREGATAAAIDAGEEGELALDQFHMMRRRSGELGPIELLLQRVKDIVVDGTRVP
jgi:hypothetical protein